MEIGTIAEAQPAPGKLAAQFVDGDVRGLGDQPENQPAMRLATARARSLGGFAPVLVSSTEFDHILSSMHLAEHTELTPTWEYFIYGSSKETDERCSRLSCF